VTGGSGGRGGRERREGGRGEREQERGERAFQAGKTAQEANRTCERKMSSLCTLLPPCDAGGCAYLYPSIYLSIYLMLYLAFGAVTEEDGHLSQWHSLAFAALDFTTHPIDLSFNALEER